MITLQMSKASSTNDTQIEHVGWFYTHLKTNGISTIAYSIVSCLNLGVDGGSFKTQKHANRWEGRCQCEPQHIKFFD